MCVELNNLMDGVQRTKYRVVILTWNVSLLFFYGEVVGWEQNKNVVQCWYNFFLGDLVVSVSASFRLEQN